MSSPFSQVGKIQAQWASAETVAQSTFTSFPNIGLPVAIQMGYGVGGYGAGYYGGSGTLQSNAPKTVWTIETLK